MIAKTFKFLALKLITILLISFSYNINAVVKKNNKGISFEGIMKPFLSIIKKKKDSVNVKKKIVRAPAVNLAKKISTLDDEEKVKVNNELRMLGISFRELPDCIEDDTNKMVSKFDTTNITDDIHSVLSSILVKLNRNSFLGEEYSKKECLDFFNKIEEIISEPSVLDAISTTIKDLVFVPLCQIRAMLEYNSKLRKSEMAHHISEKMEEIVSYIDEEIKRRNIFGSASFTKAIKNFRNIDFENFDTGIKRLSSYEYFLEVVKTHTKHLYAVGIGTAALISGLLAIKLLGVFGRKSPIDKASEAMMSMCASGSAACAMSSGIASLDISLVQLKGIVEIKNEANFKSEFGLFLPDFCLLVERLNPGLGGVYSGLILLLREAKNSPSKENCKNIISYIKNDLNKTREEIRRNQLTTIMSKSIFSEDVSKQMLDTFGNISEMFNRETGNNLCRAFAKMGDACKTISGFYWNGWSIGVNNVPNHKLAEFDQAISELIAQLKAINYEDMSEGTRGFIAELLELLEASLTRNGPESFIAISNKLKELVGNTNIFTEIRRIEGFDNQPIATIIGMSEGVQPPAVSPVGAEAGAVPAEALAGAGVPGIVVSPAGVGEPVLPPQVLAIGNELSNIASKKISDLATEAKAAVLQGASDLLIVGKASAYQQVSDLLKTVTASLEGQPPAVSPVGAEAGAVPAEAPAGAVAGVVAGAGAGVSPEGGVPVGAGEIKSQIAALGSAVLHFASQESAVAKAAACQEVRRVAAGAGDAALQKTSDLGQNALAYVGSFARAHPVISTGIATCCALPLLAIGATAAATAAASPLLATGAVGLATACVRSAQQYGLAPVVAAPAEALAGAGVSPGVAAPAVDVLAVVPVGAVVSAEGAPADPPAGDVPAVVPVGAVVSSEGAPAGDVENPAPADPPAGAVGFVGKRFIEASINYKKTSAAVVGAFVLGSALVVGAVTAPVAGICCVGAGIGAVAVTAKQRRAQIPHGPDII